MKSIKLKQILCLILIAVFMLTSCFNSQNAIDDILPDYDKRVYSLADLIPYTYKEIRNAQALYGRNLSKFFKANTTKSAEEKRVTNDEKNVFYKELRVRTANYKLLRRRLAMYTDDDGNIDDYKNEERQREFDEYYKLPNAKSAGTIRKYNNGKMQGTPLMSVRIIMSTATMSNVDAIYSEADCEIYKPVLINVSDYEELKIGDECVFELPIKNRTKGEKTTYKATCKYVGKDAFEFIDHEGKKDYLFVGDTYDSNDFCRRIVDSLGRTIDIYVENKTLQFMKLAEFGVANDIQRLTNTIASNEDFQLYTFDKMATRALSGGYYLEAYKDYVYSNAITTNHKGYVTGIYHYDNLIMDNAYYQALQDEETNSN